MTNAVQQIRCTDKASFYRLETDRRIRLILMPENRPILIGYLNTERRVLLLHKTKAEFTRNSFTLGIPQELWAEIKGNVSTVALNVRENGRYYCTSKALVEMHGRNSEDPSLRQQYVFLDFPHWTQVGGLEDVLEFYNDQRVGCTANAK